MKISPFWLTLASTDLLAAPVHARPVFQGPDCNFELLGDDGSFFLASPDGVYFVYVNVEGSGQAGGSWNGWEGGSHAHEPVGTLTRDTRDRACWSNGYARVCAW